MFLKFDTISCFFVYIEFKMHHKKINQVGYQLGYFPDTDGICAGLALSFIEAELTNTIAIYQHIIDIICQNADESSINDMRTAIENLSTKNNNLTAQDEQLIQVMAFFERIALYQFPYNYSDIFNQTIYQQHIEDISLIASSSEVENRNGMILLQHESIIYTQDEIIQLLNELASIFTNVKNNCIFDYKIGMRITNNIHAIGLVYDTASNQYSLMDSNEPEISIGINEVSHKIFTNLKHHSEQFRALHIIFLSLNNIALNNELITSLQTLKQQHVLNIDSQIAERTDKFNLAWYIFLHNRLDIVAFEKLAASGSDLNLKNQYGDTMMHIAAANDYIEILNILLKYGADFDLVNNNNDTPAFLAAMNNNVQAFEILIGAGASPHMYGEFVLICIEQGYKYVTKLLLQYNTKIKTYNDFLKTKLMHSVCYDHIENCEILIDSGADVNIYNTIKQSLLHIAIENNCYENLTMLLNNGAYANSTDANGNTPLHLAVQNNSFIAVDLLLKSRSGLNINAANAKGRTPMHFAAKSENIEICKMLIDAGANVNLEDNDELTVVHFAIESNNYPIINMLLLSKKLQLELDNKLTPLHAAAMLDRTQIMQLLLERANGNYYLNIQDDIDVTEQIINTRDQFSETPLILAVSAQQESATLLLLEHGAELNARTDKGRTAIFQAIEKQDLNLLQILLKYQANVNIGDNDNITPLHWASTFENSQILAELINYGADINAQNILGITPLMFAICASQKDAILILIKHGANLNLTNIEGETALFVAIQTQDIDIIKILLECGANTNIGNAENISPLHLAVTLENKTITRLLINYGADINAKDPNGATPLRYAQSFDNQEIITMLQEEELKQDKNSALLLQTHGLIASTHRRARTSTKDLSLQERKGSYDPR